MNRTVAAVMVAALTVGAPVIYFGWKTQSAGGSSLVLPRESCVARETASGTCVRTELTCPDPLRVAQRIDNVLFCKIGGGEKSHDKVTEKRP